MPRPLNSPASAMALGLCLFAASARFALAQRPALALDVRPGQEIAVAVTIADERVAIGAARLTKPGGAQPKDGEIAVSFVRHGLSPYADLIAIERTAAPVDFVATGLIGDIKIDEIVVCGQRDAPVRARIGSGAWRVSLNRFIVHPAAAPEPGEGDLGCPR